jgi:peptide/nickel transport system substrate-binding protein
MLFVAACGGDDGDAEETTAPTEAGAATTVPTTDAAPDDTDAAPDDTTTATTGAATTAPEGPAPTQGGELVVGGIFDAFGLEPATLIGSITDGPLGYALYDPLTTYTPDGAWEPWLAESVESTDSQTWTITLREGVQFHDGTPLDAEAVKFNLERHMDPATKSRAINNASNIDTITVVDPLTVSILLKFPWAAFPEVLAGNLGLMASPTAIAAGTANTNPVGTGPFVFAERVQGDRTVVERNDNYWRDGEPYLDKITFRVVLDDSVRTASVENGEIHAAQSIRGDVMADAEDADGIKSTQSPGHGNTIHMNTLTGPTADVRVRQALAQAIDYGALNDVIYKGTAEPDGHFIGPDNPYFDDAVEMPSYDPDAAKALIEEYEAENGPVSFTFRCYSEPSRVQMAQLVSQMWTTVGVDVEVQLSDQTTLVLDMLGGNFSVGCLSLGPETVDADLMYFNQFHSTSTNNYGKYSNPEMDAALEQGRQSSDPAVRQQAYTTVQELMARDIPTIEWSKSPWGFVLGDDVFGLVTLPGTEFHPGSVYLSQ